MELRILKCKIRVLESGSQKKSDSPKNYDSSVLNQISENIREARDSAKQALEKQADKMLSISKAKFQAAKVGENVRKRIPDVDRGKSDSRNIIAIIISTQNDSQHQLGPKYGLLNQLYERNQFNIGKESFLSIEEVPNKEISLRECDRLTSNLCGQGFQYCNCKFDGNSNRCKCKKSNIKCNSKYHKSSSCKNK